MEQRIGPSAVSGLGEASSRPEIQRRPCDQVVFRTHLPDSLRCVKLEDIAAAKNQRQDPDLVGL